MSGVRYTQEVKAEVLRLGVQGATYTQIRKRFPIPKSTLSVWFNEVGKGRGTDKEYMAAHLARARQKARIVIARNKERRHAEAVALAEQAMCKVSTNKDTLKAFAAMLYWAEGSKGDAGTTVFVNTDPLLAHFYLDLLRKVFSLDETKVRIRLHLHDYHDHEVALGFWSHLLQVPRSQFGKIYVKKRSKRKRFRENFQGICIIVYHDMRVRRELMALARLLAKRNTTQKLSSFNG